jgi:hypothetical protein
MWDTNTCLLSTFVFNIQVMGIVEEEPQQERPTIRRRSALHFYP